MVVRSPHFAKLQASYLFRLIAEKKEEYLQKQASGETENPSRPLISLGIGDTTQPLPPFIGNALKSAAEGLMTPEGYSGYPDWNGREDLRKLIAEKFYNNLVAPDEVIISDGSKPDLARMQLLFGECNIAVQDPVYPAYVDGSVIAGKTGGPVGDGSSRYQGISYLPCTPENGFFPDLDSVERKSYVLFFCSPNNPTGAVASRSQLEKLVAFAKETKSVIVFDSAYSAFVNSTSSGEQDVDVDSTTTFEYPRSIYEVPGGLDVAIETSSFSKLVGFTGVRLGWTVCPKKVMYEDGKTPLYDDWKRICGTYFNGPSNIAEAGGVACMQDKGQEEMKGLINYYMRNAKALRSVLVSKGGLDVYGGVHSPYLWAKAPSGQTSWSFWQTLLEKCQIITTPGVGFGQEGEGFVRFSCFCDHDKVAEILREIDLVSILVTFIIKMRIHFPWRILLLVVVSMLKIPDLHAH
ncbi:unnamed protein product [Amoebophrya sp. A25]|nr:unnamed protein product [Amoebophrya sp. A25]|eukprot:GSA25T00021989001.1